MKPDTTIRLDIAEDGSARLIAVDPDDDCTITDAIDIGRDGTGRRIWLLRELARREGIVLVDKRTNKRMPT